MKNNICKLLVISILFCNCKSENIHTNLYSNFVDFKLTGLERIHSKKSFPFIEEIESSEQLKKYIFHKSKLKIVGFEFNKVDSMWHRSMKFIEAGIELQNNIYINSNKIYSIVFDPNNKNIRFLSQRIKGSNDKTYYSFTKTAVLFEGDGKLNFDQLKSLADTIQTQTTKFEESKTIVQDLDANGVVKFEYCFQKKRYTSIFLFDNDIIEKCE